MCCSVRWEHAYGIGQFALRKEKKSLWILYSEPLNESEVSRREIIAVTSDPNLNGKSSVL